MPDRTHRRPGRVPATRHAAPTRPTSVADARSLGWTPGAQRHGVETGDLVRLRRGVLAAPAPAEPHEAWWQSARNEHLLAARAAVVSSPRAVISHAGAALEHSLPVLRLPDRPCLTVPAGTALRRVVEAHLHRATLCPDDTVLVGDDLVTSPARTVMDLAREFGVDPAVVTGDAALHRALVTPRELRDAFDRCRGWPGRKPAAIALCSMDARAESPLESLSRLRLRRERLPAPEPQVSIYDLAGNFLGRCDFYWDEFGVVGEADGDLKYDTAGVALDAERTRQRLFERAGLLVVRWGMRDLPRFGPVTQQLRTAFARGAGPGSASRRWVARPTPLHPSASLIRPEGTE